MPVQHTCKDERIEWDARGPATRSGAKKLTRPDALFTLNLFSQVIAGCKPPAYESGAHHDIFAAPNYDNDRSKHLVGGSG
jgi:hypothetical protein